MSFIAQIKKLFKTEPKSKDKVVRVKFTLKDGRQIIVEAIEIKPPTK